MRNILIIFFALFNTLAFSQELNCEVIVNADQTGNQNLPIFKTLETQLKEFVNKTQWTDKTFKPQERINCSMVINITSYNNDSFSGTIQIQSTRPVFNSTYSTPVYNFNDTNFSFRYVAFQNIIYNPNQYESNLVSVLSYHVYMILGLDADTFSPKGGDDYFKQAQNIVNYSQQDQFKGWRLVDGRQTRYILIDNMLSPVYKEFRSVMYAYHFGALDQMSDKPKVGKEKIANALKQLEVMNKRRPNSYIMRVFFDAKAEEIQQIFTDGPSVNVAETIETLTKIAPMHAAKWRDISF